jgi:DNA invertase Pin-like site-specific DNA recombinase
MMTHLKVLETHLKRQAVIYIRQSSPLQVEQHQESQKRQYQLVERAQLLGWSAAQCVVIDEDLGLSGAHSANRPGYQRLIAMLALREVGIILGLEVSRLARNSLDWYQLLELAAAFEVLIADEDGVYDANDMNDRLLLGLKGTISEVELYQIRARMERGRLHKAKRGELALPLPVGLDWDPVTNKPRLAVDESVRHALELVFRLFRQLRSIRGVLNYLQREQLELPYQRRERQLGRQIGWQRPSYDALYLILTNPVYAGVYCYGKKQKRLDPLTKMVRVHHQPQAAWIVFIPEHHPGYLSLAEFEENQRILEKNRNQFPAYQGTPRQGAALLQGLVLCHHCGRKMRVRYSRGQPYYTCDKNNQRYGDPICNRASAVRVDALVEELFLSLINETSLELTLSYDEKLQQEQALVERGWQEKLQRLTYEADLARRRYEMVDPANRLVAHTLETDWNNKLLELNEARQTFRAQQKPAAQLASTLAQLRHVVSHLRSYWFQPELTNQDKKEILRCLIEQVFLEKGGKVIRARVCWYGGAYSDLDVPKYLFSAPHLYHRVRDLAHTQTDQEIAATLNQEGLQTVKNKPWTPRRVMDFRLSNEIPSGFTTNEALRLTDIGYITSAEAAKQLQVDQTTIQKWYRLGILTGKHDGGQSPLWIEWTQEVLHRLNGSARPDARMVSVRSLCWRQNKSPNEVLAWAQAQGHLIYRLRRGTAMRFFILAQRRLVGKGTGGPC